MPLRITPGFTRKSQRDVHPPNPCRKRGDVQRRTPQRRRRELRRGPAAAPRGHPWPEPRPRRRAAGASEDAFPRTAALGSVGDRRILGAPRHQASEGRAGQGGRRGRASVARCRRGADGTALADGARRHRGPRRPRARQRHREPRLPARRPLLPRSHRQPSRPAREGPEGRRPRCSGRREHDGEGRRLHPLLHRPRGRPSPGNAGRIRVRRRMEREHAPAREAVPVQLAEYVGCAMRDAIEIARKPRRRKAAA